MDATAAPHRAATARLLVLAAAALLPACVSPRDRDPQVRELYRASARRETRNPVVVIHGILGARLEQRSTGRNVWGAFTGDGMDPGTPDGARALALPLVPPVSAVAHDPATAEVFAAGPLQALQVGFLFTVINVQIYADILRSLGVGGYSDRVLVEPNSPEYGDDHFTCHTFFYDWRRDCVENAMEFGRWLDVRRADITVRAQRRILRLRALGDADSLQAADELAEWLGHGFRFDVVAHSMGGLIARYWLQYGAQDLGADGAAPRLDWRGAKDIDRLVLVGTPNSGSMESLMTLVDGYAPSILLPSYDAALLGTMPAIYQLLPHPANGLLLDADGRPAPVDLFDVAVWERNGWGLLDPASAGVLEWLLPDVADAGARRTQARAYVAWCLARARAFHAALDCDAETPCPAEIRLFAADTEQTLVRARLRPDAGGQLRPVFAGDGLHESGDGTVARYSALAERGTGGTGPASWLDSPVPWSSVTFLPDDHLGLTRNPVFTDNLLFLLLAQRPRPR
ncbi:MAG TPA: hypothetical protein VF384_18340 [Planctomycetota bacterium]